MFRPRYRARRCHVAQRFHVQRLRADGAFDELDANEDGGLRPADQSTADIAGLAWPEAPADGGAVEAVAAAETEAKKRAR